MDSALKHLKHARNEAVYVVRHVVDVFNAQAAKNQPLAYGAVGAGLLASAALYKFATAERHGTPYDKYPVADNSADIYDVISVGAGPSGSTLGYFLAREGRRVALLEKKQFPRDKYCGDAVATMAQNILREMGVMKELVDEDLGHFSQNGGFVSPGGNSFIGNSAVEMKRDAKYNQGAIIAVKRIVLDEKIAKAAKRMGAELIENTNVTNAVFSPQTGVWTITAETEDKKVVIYKARVLVCADGSPSKLARQLGLVKSEPNGVCSRQYIQNNTHFKYDGVVFYPRSLLPGYCAIIREARNELNYLTYIIPGGPVKDEDLSRLHHEYMESDPFISTALGPNPQGERMKAAGLRLGGISKSYADHLLIIGDAAGLIDPLTGEGIQYAMESGKIGAQTLIEAFAKRDLTSAYLHKYHERWMKSFGHDFWVSMKMSLFMYRFPIFLDGAAKLVERRGAPFLAEWASVMTGLQSKIWFLRPDVGPFILLETFGVLFDRLFGRKKAPTGRLD